MGDLFSSLSTAGRALDAQRYGLDVVGQNIANVNTPGYSRRVVDFSTIAPASSGDAERGVDAVRVRSLRDTLLDRRLYIELPAEQKQNAIADGLSLVESALGQAGNTLDEQLESFFDSFAALAEDPTSGVSRSAVQLRGQALASSFREIAGRLESSRRDADRQVRAAVDDINSLAGRIAALNHSAAVASSDEAVLGLRDEQMLLVRKLSELVDVNVLDRGDGGVDLSIANGRALVVGDNVYAITTEVGGSDGYVALIAGGADVTDAITAGRLGGLLEVRDTYIPDYQQRLDTLAFVTVEEVNALHTGGYDLAGAPGGDFFAFSTALAGSVGAAAALVLDDEVADDTSRIAAAGVVATGDNQTARAIAQLRTALVLDDDTATLGDGWGQIVYRVGSDAKFASDEQASREQIVRQVDALRDELSGVSLDEEATNLLKFQRAYEANARYFNTIQRVLDTLLSSLS